MQIFLIFFNNISWNKTLHWEILYIKNRSITHQIGPVNYNLFELYKCLDVLNYLLKNTYRLLNFRKYYESKPSFLNNPGVVSSNPGSANFLSDDWQKSMRHASFVFHQWAKSMWKSSQLLGKIVVWSTGVRKPGNAWVGELVAVI